MLFGSKWSCGSEWSQSFGSKWSPTLLKLQSKAWSPQLSGLDFRNLGCCMGTARLWIWCACCGCQIFNYPRGFNSALEWYHSKWTALFSAPTHSALVGYTPHISHIFSLDRIWSPFSRRVAPWHHLFHCQCGGNSERHLPLHLPLQGEWPTIRDSNEDVFCGIYIYSSY